MTSSVGTKYKSFLFTKHLPLEELQATLIEAVHTPTGARIVHIANDDPENLFCLSFQTLPTQSNGVAHILEHTVLCGSKKFPIKDPFFSMTRRSLNTYMNALTGQDFTCYPASSQVKKDFYNLLEVYLDAVFHPELKHLSFLQEGHRLELSDPKNPSSPLQFQGVVYNEMKGAMSSSESRLWEVLMHHLTPDLPYGLNSGGDPKVIPSLTYEELKEFHAAFYHPSRCLFFFYGNLPLSSHLDFLEKHALTDVPKIPLLPPLPLQKRFTAPIAAEGHYPIAPTESLEKKRIIAFAWLTAPLTNQSETLALCLLDSLLTDTDISPLKKALLQSGHCTQAASSVDTEMSEVPFILTCKGCEASDAAPLKALIFKTLQDIRFTKEDIEASLHQLEFERTEIGAEGMPFGLTLFFRSCLPLQHGGAPEHGLLIHSLFDNLRNRLQDPDYLPSLLRKHLLNNPHFVQVILHPDPQLDAKEKIEEEQRLTKLRPHIDLPSLLEQTNALATYQEAIESQSLACLPKLSLRDVPPDARDFPLTQHENIFHHACFTNKILYADLVYDLPHIPLADLPLLSLYTRFLTELGCGGRTYADTLAAKQAHTGGLSATLSLHIQENDPNLCRPSLTLRGNALDKNSPQLLSLLTDFSRGVDCTDTPRIQELLAQLWTALQNRLTKNALTYATQTALSSLSPPSFLNDQWSGLPFFRAVQTWSKDPASLSQELTRIQKTALAINPPHLVLSCDADQYTRLKIPTFPTQKGPLWQNDYPLPKITSHGRFIGAPVAFTASAIRTQPHSPHLLLATELLDNCFLHKEIREKGGAYGSGAQYTPATGNFYLYSYRDPNLSKTIHAFRKALEKIASGTFTKRDLEDAKFGVLQTLDAPVPPGNRALTAYTWHRAGRTYGIRQTFRQQILTATAPQISTAVQELLTHEPILVTYLGEELYKKESKKLKHPLPIEN